MIRFKFHEEKAIAALLYITRRLISLKSQKAKPDLHKIFGSFSFQVGNPTLV
jgi:hypothetical protein